MNQIFNQTYVPPFPFSLFFFPLQNLGEDVEVHNLSCSNLINYKKKVSYKCSVPLIQNGSCIQMNMSP